MVMWLTLAAAIVLTLTAVAGATLARRHLAGTPVSIGAGLGHAGMAVIGIATVITAMAAGGQPLVVNTALLLLVLTGIGGGFMLLFKLQREPVPGLMMTLHAGMALVALILLWIGVLRLL